MGCCSSDNKVEPVPHEPSQSNRQNQTAIQENRELKTDTQVSNESEISTQDPNNSNITEPKAVTKIDVKPKNSPIIDRDLLLVNEPNTESEDNSSIALESDPKIKSNTRSNNQSAKGSDNEEENGPNTESDNNSSVALESEHENRQNTASDNDEETYKNKPLITTHSPIGNRDQSLEEQVNEWKSLIETLTSNKKLMAYGLAKPRTHFKSVSEVGDYLEACQEAKSNTEKAWLIYVWITHNIAYDVQTFLSGDYRFCEPPSVLRRGLALCTGYANLYKELCQHLGIECVLIGGYSKDESQDQKIDHTWNAIPLGSDGKLRFIESTWGAGHIFKNKMFKKVFQPYYFAVPAHIFNETHYSESYTPTDGTKKFTLEEFENCPNNKLGYHILGLSSANNTMQAINRTTKNPFVLEYTSWQRVYFIVSLIDDETGYKIENAGFVQSEYSYSNDQKSKYCLIVDIPENGRKYKIQLLAKNERYFEDDEKSFPIITEFFVIREGDEENLIPRYNLTFDHDLRLKSHSSPYIKFKTNPLVIQFESPNNSQTSQIDFLAILVNTINNAEIKYLVQSEYFMSKDHKSRYCFIVDMPENISQGKKYILKLFAKNKRDSDNKDKKFPFLTEFILIREYDEESYKPANNVLMIPESDKSDKESYIPKYLTFAHDIKLKSHNCKVIEFKTNPLRMKFEVPKHIKTLFEVRSINNSKIAHAVFSQINPENSDTVVQVAIPRKGEKFRFQIFAKDLRDKRSKFVYSNQLFLTRTESNENDALKFCKVYPRGQNCFIYSPIEYYLTSNSKYEFKYFIKDALDVAIVDSSKKVKYMNREDQHIWVLITTLKAKGIVNVLAKFDEKSDYDYICNYEVI